MILRCREIEHRPSSKRLRTVLLNAAGVQCRLKARRQSLPSSQMVRKIISSHANNPSHRVGKIWNYGLYLVQPRQNPTFEQGTVLVEADVCIEVSLGRRCRAHSAMKTDR